MGESVGRDELFADASVTGLDLVRAYTSLVDDWLIRLFDAASSDPSGLALVAVGGYGRAELCPQSDIDVVLLHDKRSDVPDVADALWYPIWDEGVKLGHAVRTTREALDLAAEDLDTATSLLTTRHLAGDADLTATLTDRAEELWKKRAKRWLGDLGERVTSRHLARGEVAFLLEPDLKESRGGLRDVHAIGWAERAGRVILEVDRDRLTKAHDTLLGVRAELHRHSGRPSDVLLLQEQDAVAGPLGYADADALMVAVSSAGRAIAWESDEVWDAVSRTVKGARGWRSARDRAAGDGLVLRDGRIHLTGDADPGADPVLPLRAAAAAAGHDARIARSSLERLAAESVPLPEPWPGEARERLVELLLAGRPAVDVIESLDQRDLLVPIIPEWAPNRSRPQRNAYHRFTVDRHLIEAAVGASHLADQVSRPDLLVIGALLHDVGKGYPGDHTEVGMDLVRTIGTRMGLAEADVDVLVTLVEQHLLLPDVATRRDLADDATLQYVAERVGDLTTLELLGALTEADSLATGPAAWGSWKAELVADLVRRTAHVLGGGDVEEVASATFPTDEQQALLDAGEPRIIGADDRLTVVMPDRPGLFSRAAGVLALNGLDVLDAAVLSDERGMALETFRVESTSSPVIAWDGVVADLEEVFAGRLALQARLAERARTYAPLTGSGHERTEPRVTIDEEASEHATVVEVHAPDGIGVLYRLTRALADLDLDVQSAKVQTLGKDVVDSFYLTDRSGNRLADEAQLVELERAILHALSDAF